MKKLYQYSSLVQMPLILALAGCAERYQEVGLDCFGIDDCNQDQVCFLGKCVDPGYGISTIYLEATPPSDSGLLVQQHGPLELSSAQEITLAKSADFKGYFYNDDQPQTEAQGLAGLVTARLEDPVIPGRELSWQATALPGQGFSMKLLPGSYEVTFARSEDALFPPKEYRTNVAPPASPADEPEVHALPYPAENTLVEVSGKVLYSDSTREVVPLAEVTGTAFNERWVDSPLQSSVARTGEDGVFTLRFPPGARLFSVTVGPGTRPGDNPLVPEATFSGLVGSGEGDDWLGELILGVKNPHGIELNAVVLDQYDAPIADADVLFEGESVGDAEGSFSSAERSSSPNGSVHSTLLAGNYRITVVPTLAQPYALSSSVAEVPSSEETVVLRVNRKVRLSGVVLSHDGTPVGDAELTLTRRDSPVVRVFHTTSWEDGSYSLTVDPGPGAVDGSEVQYASYELVLQAPYARGLPFHRELLKIGTQDLPNHVIRLHEAELIYGKVIDPAGNPTSNEVLSFLSLELGYSNEPLVVGVVRTGEGARAGEFVLPIPILDSHQE